ncbi:MAG: stage III sporulation protein AE [Alicyclobacillaceae bacterium]|nr:stage III sporulation protein AE [Alicyclobacillaceae bacterium]
MTACRCKGVVRVFSRRRWLAAFRWVAPLWLLMCLVSAPVAAADASGAHGTTASASNLLSTGTASSSVRQDAEEQLDQLPTGAIDSYWQRLHQEYGGYLPDFGGTSLTRAMFDGGTPSLKAFFSGVLRYFFAELFGNARLLGAILVLSVMAAVLESFQAAFERQAVSQVAYAMVFLVLMVLAVGSFTEAFGAGRHAIQTMTDFMLASIPVLIALLAASGAVASAAFFHPVLAFTVHAVSQVVFLFVFPLIFFSAVLDLTSALSPRYRLTRLAGLLRGAGAAGLGLCMSVFIGVTAVQGAGKGIADGVALRAAKFGVQTFVPVLGKAMSDAMETVASASLLVKNAVGMAGLVVLACAAAFPAVKILALSFVYSGSAALMQPLGDNPIVGCLGALSKSLVYVFAAVTVVALMFFVAVCMLLATANLAVVMG